MDAFEPPPKDSSNPRDSSNAEEPLDAEKASNAEEGPLQRVENSSDAASRDRAEDSFDAEEDSLDLAEESSAEPQRPFQYSLSTLFLITTLAAFAAAAVRWGIDLGDVFVGPLVTGIVVLGMTGIIVMGTLSVVHNFGRVSELRWLKMIQRFYVAVLFGGTSFVLLASLLTWLLHVCFPR